MSFLEGIDRPVVAHRGNRAHAPENTIEAFERALTLGPDALEFDVRLSRDGVAMVIHDATVDRTTSGAGAVASLSRQELQSFDAGWSHRSPDGEQRFRETGVTIPTLEATLEALGHVPLIIEVKEERAVAETKRLLARFNLTARVLIGSVHRNVMQHFYGGPYETCASMKDAALLLTRIGWRRTRSRPPFSVLSITPWYEAAVPFPVPVVTLSRIAADLGIPTHVWTINDPVQASRLWRAGISAILSDDIEPIMQARAAAERTR
ncbi:MAG: glycerophosphodiester phosphodiesterase family protein [Gemmatimonadota bacterium]